MLGYRSKVTKIVEKRATKKDTYRLERPRNGLVFLVVERVNELFNGAVAAQLLFTAFHQLLPLLREGAVLVNRLFVDVAVVEVLGKDAVVSKSRLYENRKSAYAT